MSSAAIARNGSKQAHVDGPKSVEKFNIEAEMCILGCAILASGKDFRGICREVRPEIFFAEPYRIIWETIAGLHEGGADRVDFVTMRDDLARRGLFGKKGINMDLLIKIAEAVPSVANWRHYLGIVRKDWQFRAMGARLRGVDKMIQGDEPIDQILAAIDGLTAGLSVTGDPWFEGPDVPLNEQVDHRGVPSGFSFIDKSNHYRGWPGSRISLIVGRTNSGKSLIASQSALHAGSLGLRVGYVTLELTAVQIKRRMIRQLCGFGQVPNNLEDDQRFRAGIDEFDMLDLSIFDVAELSRASRDFDELTVESLARFSMDKHDRRPFDVLFIDYLSKLSTSKRLMTEHERLRAIGNRLHLLATSMAIPVVVVSQTTVDQHGALKSKGSEGPMEAAALILEVDRKADSDKGVFNLSKQTFGKAGISHPVEMDARMLRFREAV